MRVFLSYGHDHYAVLAGRLKQDLEARGHEVWFDVARLRPGRDWEHCIEDGLNWASVNPGEGRFLLLLTPDSVRRPDGYCLNELAMAFGRNLPIIPVMLSSVEPPLSICRLQWLDMRNCFPVQLHEAQYAKQFELLAKALLEKQVPFEGVQQRLLNYLNPVAYDDDLTKHLLRFTGREWVIRFTGREWVMGEVDKWLASSQRILWITGDAGVGKSALAAWLCNKRPEIAAYHFCRFGNSDRVDARRTLLSLAYQLSTQLPLYQDRLNASPLDKTVIETNVRTVFDRLFVNLLTDTVPIADKPQVLLIDALDEATTNERNELASLISDEVDRLPPWLRVIVTSRPHEQEINFALQALDPWKLDAGREENRQDIRAYLYRELRPFVGNGDPPNDIVNAIVERSEGLFLYVTWVRHELEDGRLSLARVEEFPRGLGGVYAGFFRRYFPDVGEYKSGCRPALEAVCAAREPLELFDELAPLLGWPDYEMRSLTARLGSLFPVMDGRVRPFHHSVRDWLTDPQRSGPYWIDVSAQEQRLADLAWREYMNGVNTMGRYCITYGPSHLVTCKRKKEIKELLLDPDWMVAKIQAAGIVPLLTDYDLALDMLSPGLRGEGGRPAVAPVGLPSQQTLQATAAEADRRVTEDSETSALRLVQGAIRLSSHVIAIDSGQFASQMVGRLLAHHDLPSIEQFTTRVVEGASKPWLRPLQPALDPPGTFVVRTLRGHSDRVWGVAVSAEGRRAASASGDHTLKVWDLETGRELHTLKGHSDRVSGVALSADGRRAISGSRDRTLKVWDLGTGRELHTLEGHSDAVVGVAVSVDGRRVVSGSDDGNLKVWDLDTERELHTLSGHSKTVSGVAVSGDGRLAVSASCDHTLKVWDLETGRELHTLKGHSDTVSGVAVSADGRLAVSGSDDKTLKVWDLETGLEIRSLRGHLGFVEGVAISANGLLGISACSDSTLKVWDLANGSELRTLKGHSGNVEAVAMSADGRRAVSASSDRTLKVWDLQMRSELPAQESHSAGVIGVAVSADGRCAASISKDRTLKLWDLETRCVLSTLEEPLGFNHGVALSPDARRAVFACGYGLKVWDLTTARELHNINVFYNWEVSADCRRAVVDFRGKLEVWDLEGGHRLCDMGGHAGQVTSLAVSADGRRAVSASFDEALKLWDLESGCELRTLKARSSGVTDVAISPDGCRAVSAYYDNTVTVWNLEKGSELRKLDGHGRPATCLALSGDGRRAVSASDDNTLRVWEVDTGALLATFTCDASARCFAFISDDRLIAGDAGGHIHFLRLEELKRKD